MEWTRETKLKLARRIRELSLEIQKEEFSTNNGKHFAEGVKNIIKRIMERLAPLGFEPANKDWMSLEQGVNTMETLYEDSETHLWFETAQCRIVKIRKKDAEKVLILGFP